LSLCSAHRVGVVSCLGLNEDVARVVGQYVTYIRVETVTHNIEEYFNIGFHLVDGKSRQGCRVKYVDVTLGVTGNDNADIIFELSVTAYTFSRQRQQRRSYVIVGTVNFF